MRVKIKVGQIWTDGDHRQRYQITRIDSNRQPWARNFNYPLHSEVRFAYTLDINDQYDMPPDWYLEDSKPRKIIPDIPLDPSLPILQAGHLQDRQRKQFKRIKVKENVK